MDPYHAVQNYGRFKKSVNIAATLTKNIEGNTGELIICIIDSLSELARSFHSDWKGSWTAPTDAKLAQQQANTLDALKEIARSVNRTIDIFNWKKRDEELKRTAVTNKATTSVPTTSAPKLTKEVTAIEQLPSTSQDNSSLFSEECEKPTVEIKEELMDVDIKEEPLDEPLSDTYCPSTGTSTSFGAMPCLSAESSTTLKTVEQSNEDGSVTVRKWRQVQGTVEKANTQSILADQAAAWQIEPINSYLETGHAQYKRCYLCNQHIYKYFKTPEHPGVRAAFLFRVMRLPPPEKNKLAELKKNGEVAFLCPGHLHNPTTVPKKKILTDDEKMAEKNSVMKNEGHSLVIQSNGAIGKVVPAKRSKLAISTRCDLCGSPAYPFTLSPKEPGAAQRFIHTLHNVTQAQVKKLQFYVRYARQWTVCRRHFPDLGKLATTNATFIAPMEHTVSPDRASSDEPSPSVPKKRTIAVLPTSTKPKVTAIVTPDGVKRYTASPVYLNCLFDLTSKPMVKPSQVFVPMSRKTIAEGRMISNELSKISTKVDNLMKTVQQHTADVLSDKEVKMEEPDEVKKEVKEEEDF